MRDWVAKLLVEKAFQDHIVQPPKCPACAHQPPKQINWSSMTTFDRVWSIIVIVVCLAVYVCIYLYRRKIGTFLLNTWNGNLEIEYWPQDYFNSRLQLQNEIQQHITRRSDHAKLQANHIMQDAKSGTLYGPYTQTTKWIELEGHFVEIYHERVSQTFHVYPHETIAEIMSKANIQNESLYHGSQKLDDLDQTLLEYGIPDNTKVCLVVGDRFARREELEDFDEYSVDSI